jgi:hypothetical protein
MISGLYNQFQTLKYFVKTKKFIDIEWLGKLKKCIAVPVADSLVEIAPGVWFKQESRWFSEGNFTNVYDIFWDSKDDSIVASIDSSNTPYFLSEKIKYHPQTIACINGGFFFLTDIANRKPYNLPYNLCIREGKIFGLPSYDQPIVYIKNGVLDAREVLACGTIDIGGKKISWAGAHSKKKAGAQAVLYNSKCCDVVKVRDKNNIQIGILDEVNIFTPNDVSRDDIIVNKDIKGGLIVSEINQGGGTHFFEGLFTLQIKKGSHNFKIGDKVTPLDIDGLNLSQITSGITIGRNVHDRFFYEDVRVNRQDARSVIAKDAYGKIHFIVFDGSKYVPSFAGVSAKEIADYFSSDRFHWAYFLDGGGSSRIIYRNGKKIAYLANEFAFRKLDDGKKVWDWKNARKMTSSISIKIK